MRLVGRSTTQANSGDCVQRVVQEASLGHLHCESESRAILGTVEAASEAEVIAKGARNSSSPK